MLDIQHANVSLFWRYDKMKVYSNFGIGEMLNEEQLPCKTCINLTKSVVEVMDSEEDITEEHLLIPAVEELYPYNKCIGDYLGREAEDVPRGMSASHYLRSKQRMTEFYVYRRSAAVNRLIGWLQAHDIEICYEEYVPCERKTRKEHHNGLETPSIDDKELYDAKVDAHLIIKTVAEYYQVTVEQIVSKSRSMDIVKPRYVAMYLCRTLLQMKIELIAKIFGDRDTSTVVHACKQISYEIEKNQQLQVEIKSLKEKIMCNC